MSYAALFPFSLTWFVAVLLLIAAARPDSISGDLRSVSRSSMGIVVLFGLGLFTFFHRPILGTAMFILLFSILMEEDRTALVATQKLLEGYTNDIQTDIITSKKKWYVESVLDERPKAIRERTVTTYAPSS